MSRFQSFARQLLTLGALAELEAGFGVDDLSGLGERFASGRFSARDVTRILGTIGHVDLRRRRPGRAPRARRC